LPTPGKKYDDWPTVVGGSRSAIMEGQLETAKITGAPSSTTRRG
jgi:hypothetical protein